MRKDILNSQHYTLQCSHQLILLFRPVTGWNKFQPSQVTLENTTVRSALNKESLWSRGEELQQVDINKQMF